MESDVIKRLKDDPYFQQFVVFIVSKIAELENLDGLLKLDNEKAGEEAKVRALTSGKLREILSPFVDFNEKKDPSEAEIKEAGDKFGL